MLRRIRFCDLLGLRQQGPTFGQNEPRPSLVGIVAPVCIAKAFSHFDATVVAFGHRDSMVLKAYQFLSQDRTVTSGDRRRFDWLVQRHKGNQQRGYDNDGQSCQSNICEAWIIMI